MEEEITRGFVPRADLILFVTSLLQPLTASELDFLEHIRDWGKKVIFVVNGADRRNSEDQLGRGRRREQEGFVPRPGLGHHVKPAGPQQPRQQCRFSGAEKAGDQVDRREVRKALSLDQLTFTPVSCSYTLTSDEPSSLLNPAARPIW